MKYRDTIQFEPLETTIQIGQADRKETAAPLVASYVISDEMAERLSNILFPQLQFEYPADNKGLLIVGNYGTGKSHLMSLISAIAEHADLVEHIKNSRVRADAVSIAGKFKVARTELNTTMSLRDAMCSTIETYLASIGVSYTFPPSDQVVNNKIPLEEMMAVFAEQYPQQGLLLVVDELLDYLRSRMGQGTSAVIADFNFLREIGEVAKDLRFRFIAGVQVSLFESPEFEFVADSLRRVKDRFEQLSIARRDVKFVIAERLLAKTAEQHVKIREHLLPFAKFYGDMNERMDEYVSLFPIHPEYIDVFELLTIVEKRQVMKSLSQAMQSVLDLDVPTGEPGLIAFDRYWGIMSEDASLRSIPEVREVVERSNKLESLIDLGYPKKGAAKQLAIRIVHALSVYRLAVGNIEAKIGLTAENLRDNLCLYDPLVAEMGGDPAEDLRGAIETALRLIRKTVNGQFISSTERDGGQYYLDVKKTIDYDSQIEKRAETLGLATLDRYYTNALMRVLECSDRTLVSGCQIWQHELEWLDRKTSRLGYLFFGAPNDRSTASPPREFYLYFLPRYREAEFKDEKHTDEVFFRLARIDATFDTNLKQYAAALNEAATAAGDAKNVYNSKAAASLQLLVNWLQDNLMTAYEVTYQGKTKPLMEWLKGNVSLPSLNRANVKDFIDTVSSVCLAPHFSDRAPEYPRFSILITEENRGQAAQETLRGIANPNNRSKQTVSVLSALELLDGEKLVPDRSRYARHILDLLQQKGQGQVLNYSELIQEDAGVPYMEASKYRLEPEWAIVIIAVLVREYNYTLTIPGKKFDAMNFAELANTPVKDLIDFQHLKAPKDYDLEALKALCNLFGLETGKAVAITQGGKVADDATQDIGTAALRTIERVVAAQQTLQSKLGLFGKALASDGEQSEYRSRLDRFKDFLQSLQAYNTHGKLKTFRYAAQDVNSQHVGLDTLEEVERLRRSIAELGVSAGYLAEAELILPSTHSWVEKWKVDKEAILARITSPTERSNRSLSTEISAQLQQTKQEYIQTYQILHVAARLGNSADTRKQQLLSDSRLKSLEQLATVRIVHISQLQKWRGDLVKLQSCFVLTESDLQTSPRCPHCDFKPSDEISAIVAEDSLQHLDRQLDDILASWTQRLLEELEDPAAQENLELLSARRKKLVNDFRSAKTLPNPIANEFIQAINEVLSNLSKIAISPAELVAALKQDGTPATSDDIEQRFKIYLNGLLKGEDRKNVRIVLEE
jgi:Family of unknown function (DUF6079)